MAVPRLAEVQCSRLKFEAGDRILVRVYQLMDKDDVKKLKKTIQKWAGCEVEVLIVDCTRMGIEIDNNQLQGLDFRR